MGSGAYEALAHFLWVAEKMGPFGLPLTEAFAQGVPLLNRIYMAHISLLPIIVIVMIGLHLFYIKYHKLSQLPDATQPSKNIPFTQHMAYLRRAGLWDLITNLSACAYHCTALGRRTSPRPRSYQTTLAICLDLRLGKSMGTFFNCSPTYNYRVFASYSHSRPKQRALLEKAPPRYHRFSGFYINFRSTNYLG